MLLLKCLDPPPLTQQDLSPHRSAALETFNVKIKLSGVLSKKKKKKTHLQITKVNVPLSWMTWHIL